MWSTWNHCENDASRLFGLYKQIPADDNVARIIIELLLSISIIFHFLSVLVPASCSERTKFYERSHRYDDGKEEYLKMLN